MKSFSEIALDNTKSYSITTKSTIFDKKQFDKTVSNALKLLAANHPIILVSPEEQLTKTDLEQFRRFFCKEAKNRGFNFIYFEVPIIVSEIDPLEDTMFA